MKRTQAAAVAVALFAGLALGALVSPRPDMPVTIAYPGAAWTRTYEYPPPENTPIVGYWVWKGERIIFESEGEAGIWYEWSGRPERGPVVFDFPPIAWIGQPDAAR